MSTLGPLHLLYPLPGQLFLLMTTQLFPHSLVTLSKTVALVPMLFHHPSQLYIPPLHCHNNIIHTLFILFVYCLSHPLEWKPHVSRNFYLFCSLLYFQYLEQCLRCSQCSTNISFNE